MFWSLASLLLLTCGLVHAQDENVLVLTSGNFSDVVSKNDKLVVEFYAPWCGHCKKLAPEYEKAAGVLKDEGIVLANVDATLPENKELASKYGIQGFPTLKVFRGNEDAASDYQGPREADGIVSYCKSEFGPASTQLNTTAELDAVKTPSTDIVVVGAFKDGGDSAALKTFLDVANSMRGSAVFHHVVDTSIMGDTFKGEDMIVLYKSFDEKEAIYTGTISKDDVKEWIEKKSTPRLVSLDKSPTNKKALAAIFGDQSKPKVIGILPSEDDQLAAFHEQLIAVNEANDDIHVVYLDPKENPGAMDFFGVKAENCPLLAVHAPDTNAKYTSGKIALDSIKEWVADFKAGKIEKTVKSEEIPESNDGPVTVVVGKNFDAIVKSGKNVFIEFYAPWCGHCKRLEPIWTELAEKVKDNDQLVIAKMDATANDVPDDAFDVKGFPTLYFVKADGSSEKYSGGRTLEDFEKFIAENVPSSDDKKDEL